MDNDARGRGRPRLWASSAERSRAYRARKQQELSEPTALRSEVRNLRQQLRAARRELDTYQRRCEQLEQELTRASARARPTEASAQTISERPQTHPARDTAGDQQAATTGTTLATALNQTEHTDREVGPGVQGELFTLAPVPIVPRAERA